MKKLVRLLFLVNFLTQPAIGRYQHRDGDKRLTILEYKLSLIFEDLANLKADVKAHFNNNDQQVQNNTVENCPCIKQGDIDNGHKKDHSTTLEEMLMKTKILYTGFKELKQAVSVPVKTNELRIDHIEETQKSLIQKAENQESNANRHEETSNQQSDNLILLNRNIQTLQENTENYIQNLDDKLKGIAVKVNNLERKMQFVCPPGWYRYHNKCYFLNEDDATWKDAVSYCKSVGAKLVEYDNQEEINFVLQLALSSKFDWGSYHWTGFYIGGSDSQSEGNFIWETSKTPVPNFGWLPGQPSNYHNKEHCMMTLVNKDGKWNDSPCDTKEKFVCEKQED